MSLNQKQNKTEMSGVQKHFLKVIFLQWLQLSINKHL